MGKDTTEILKYMSLGLTGLYLYNRFKNTDSVGLGELENKKKAYNAVDYIVDELNIPPQYKEKIKNHAKRVATNVIESKINIRDVTPIEGS